MAYVKIVAKAMLVEMFDGILAIGGGEICRVYARFVERELRLAIR